MKNVDVVIPVKLGKSTSVNMQLKKTQYLQIFPK